MGSEEYYGLCMLRVSGETYCYSTTTRLGLESASWSLLIAPWVIKHKDLILFSKHWKIFFAFKLSLSMKTSQSFWKSKLTSAQIWKPIIKASLYVLWEPITLTQIKVNVHLDQKQFYSQFLDSNLKPSLVKFQYEAHLVDRKRWLPTDVCFQNLYTGMRSQC